MAGALYRIDYAARTTGGGAIYIGEDGVTGMDVTGTILFSGGLRVTPEGVRGAITLNIKKVGVLVTGRAVYPGDAIPFDIRGPIDLFLGGSYSVNLDGMQVVVTLTKISDVPIPPGSDPSNPFNGQQFLESPSPVRLGQAERDK